MSSSSSTNSEQQQQPENQQGAEAARDDSMETPKREREDEVDLVCHEKLTSAELSAPVQWKPIDVIAIRNRKRAFDRQRKQELERLRERLRAKKRRFRERKIQRVRKLTLESSDDEDTPTGDDSAEK